MRALILVFSIFFISSSSAQDPTEYGFATINLFILSKSIENLDEAFKYLDEFM